MSFSAEDPCTMIKLPFIEWNSSKASKNIRQTIRETIVRYNWIETPKPRKVSYTLGLFTLGIADVSYRWRWTPGGFLAENSCARYFEITRSSTNYMYISGILFVNAPYFDLPYFFWCLRHCFITRDLRIPVLQKRGLTFLWPRKWNKEHFQHFFHFGLAKQLQKRLEIFAPLNTKKTVQKGVGSWKRESWI